ncbi:MAG: hypothetical protein EA341_03225 [Mongoliibacter sp.]|uniref:hypothetical protein n=1 Tax=Mongoliibacter sp. TaxID=2022438 RepID=UPI0012F27E84|nr:hypothetical protein [Mongoliibacter sp.]TVP52479.1 MAG: hypothetical protein EA341_03225 [Mongoliibacter sp.]
MTQYNFGSIFPKDTRSRRFEFFYGSNNSSLIPAPYSWDQPKTHTFYANQGVTVKEAFNLLEGRAVQKSLLNAEKEPYKAWLQLDLGQKEPNGNFKLDQYHENYGYDVKKVLESLPIKEAFDPSKADWLLKAVQKGNQYPVTMQKDGKEETMYVEANPKFKSLNVYDAQMRTVKTNDLLLSNSMANEPDESKKKARMKPETPQVPKASKGKRI